MTTSLDNLESQFFPLELPSDLIRSEIVYNNEWTMEEKIRKLIGKYLLSNSPLTLNISFPVRSYFIDLHKDKNLGNDMGIQEKCTLFRPVIKEVIVLMRDSFLRFRQTEFYNKLLEEQSEPSSQNRSQNRSQNPDTS
ncbi:hypothetical protein RFI_30443 [Reticulomyxa filosa]|uniref:RGS domain-containing protein n=1 Tax=Reticulomyxa filosa TaxID=46433 RepID=X6M041_RETFI|nr:hypothetical protein RFI_30443 [Reticulomyxa filosa]|eukprot:ETO06951.1 hypothetical protein RFI_30443 [Reticulomyxa filosa]